MAAGISVAGPVMSTLPNGLRLVVLPTTASQAVSVELLVGYSAFDAPADAPETRQVVLDSILMGSSRMSGDAIRQTVSAAGGTIGGRVHPDTLELFATLPAVALPEGLTSLSEMVCHPSLSDAGIETAIGCVEQSALADAPTSALTMAYQLAHKKLYAGHPYGADFTPAPANLDNLTAADVRAICHRWVTPKSTVIAVVGRCNADEVRQQMATLFGNWAGEDPPARKSAVLPVLKSSQIDIRKAPVKSTCVLFTFPTCGAFGRDDLPLRLIETLLSGGTGARLFRKVREQHQIAYEVSTLFPNQAACSDFSVYALTQSARQEETKAILVDELARLQVEPVPAAELGRAKAYLKGQYLLRHQSSAQYAFDLAWDTLEGPGITQEESLDSRIDAVTAQDLLRVARSYFTRYYLVIISPHAGS